MKAILKKIWKVIVDWNEFITVPLAFILWYLSPLLLRNIDPTSATYDAGIFQVIIFTTIQMLIYNGIIWFILKITWPKLYNFLDDIFEGEGEIKGLSTWERVKMVLFIFAIYFIGIILLSRVIG
jgi:hypothetical protein